MSDKDFDIYLKEVKAFHKDIQSSKNKALKFMQDAGILDKDGKLSSNYK